jgi:hypothetical protein
VYLNEIETPAQARVQIEKWFDFYNYEKPHSVFDRARPMEIYFTNNEKGGGMSLSLCKSSRRQNSRCDYTLTLQQTCPMNWN